MRVELSLHDEDSLLTVTGDVGTVDVPVLRGRILDALEANRGDVLLDMRQVRSVSDHLMAALSAARSRAKHLRHRVVVVDAATGVMTGGLRRRGMQFRIPVYPDPAAALAGLHADREARARLVGGGRGAPSPAPALPRGSHDRRGPDPQDAAPEPSVQAGRALWAAAAHGPGSGGRP